MSEDRTSTDDRSPTTEPQDPKTEKSGQPKSRVQILLQALISGLLNLVTLSAILTIAGFFIVHSYIAKVTGLFTYNVSATQYLAAGINLMLALVWNLLLPVLLPAILIGIVGGVVWVLVRRLVIPFIKWITLLIFNHLIVPMITRFLSLEKLQKISDQVRVVTVRFVKRGFLFVKAGWRVYQIITAILFVFLIAVICFGYGYNYYGYSPRMFGGGMPANVVLVFKDAQLLKDGLQIAVNSRYSMQSEPVDLLVELTDGLLVRDVRTGLIVIIKNDSLQAVIDASSLPVATTQVVPVPTATP